MYKICEYLHETEEQEWGESPLFLAGEELTAKISISK